ncbi:hypothetical protein FQN54_006737 [Arachnomyces sp. PD_36]|nr:hypothetical protein FQN54_006737 [Arachnomyces sp. PD_36]
MAPERVIQDSDDEDLEEEIPTSADPLQPSPSLSVNSGVALALEPDEGSGDALIGQSADGSSHQIMSGGDLGVNFDYFLQSQSQTGQTATSPLQPHQYQIVEASIHGANGRTSGDINNGPQSPLNLQLKRAQSISSFNETGETRESHSKKGSKRCKTMDVDSPMSHLKPRFSPSGDDNPRASEEHQNADRFLNRGSKVTQDIEAFEMPTDADPTPKALKSFSRRRQTDDYDDGTAKPKKTARRCASTITKDMNDAWDRDRLDFKSGPVSKNAVGVEVSRGLTTSQEEEYEILNDEGLHGSHFHTNSVENQVHMNFAPGMTSDDRSNHPRMEPQENPPSTTEPYKPNGMDHNSTSRYSTPRRENSVQIAVAISPHDTEELSSFSSPHRRINSTSSIMELSQRTPEDPFHDRPPYEQKPGRKRKPTFVDDSDESPDELNLPDNRLEEKSKPLSRRSSARVPEENGDDDDDDMVIIQPKRRASRTLSHSNKPRDEPETQVVEEQQPNNSASTNSDEIDMPPKEQYKPRPSRSRGKPVEPEPEPPVNEPKKKKIKRGKTTSVMLKKAVESDVEDDVVWVDEKPTGVVFRDPILPARRKAKQSRESSVYVEHDVVPDEEESPTTNLDTEPAQEARKEKLLDDTQGKPAETTKPPPKKRGRKPKKAKEAAVPIETPIEDQKTERKGEEVSKAKMDIVPEDDGATAPQDEPQDKLTPDSPKNPEDIELSNTPEAEEPKPSPSPTVHSKTKTPPPLETPKKQTTTTTTSTEAQETMTPPNPASLKGPDKHSPISTTGSVPYRVGLSRRANIAPLLKIVRK